VALAPATRRATIEPRPKRRTAPPAVNPDGFDRNYWITHSEGFRVEGGEGRIGVVHHILEDGSDRTTLAVLAGRLGRRLLLIQADEIAFIVPRAKRIWLRTPTTIVSTQAL